MIDEGFLSADGTQGNARFSDCRRYRYALSRVWCAESPTVLFLMLNPSTADAEKFDPTVRRCFGYAKTWGYGVMRVANLFAYRATKPKDLIEAHRSGVDVIGPENDEAIRSAAKMSDLILCAWGAKAFSAPRAQAVEAILAEYPLHCLRETQLGQPVHPLYQSRHLKPKLLRAAIR
jgi:hypothetical protein